jgi:hypothetical protein
MSGLLSAGLFTCMKSTMLSRAVLVPTAVVLVLAGCNQPRWDTPEDAYLSFVTAMQKGDSRTAWMTLSAQSKQALEARARAVSEATSGAVKPNPQPFFFGGGFDTAPVKAVRRVSQEGNAARLSVVGEGGAEREVSMIKEPEGWRLDVTEMLGEMGATRDQ